MKKLNWIHMSDILYGFDNYNTELLQLNILNLKTNHSTLLLLEILGINLIRIVKI